MAVVFDKTFAETTPNVFEVKKHNEIFFGDLEDLKNVQRTFDHPPRNKFFHGNYSLSLLKFGDSGTSKSVAIFHQENVDPNLVIKELLEWKKGRSSHDQGTKAVGRGVGTKDVFGPSDWLTGQRRAAAAETSCTSSLKGAQKSKSKRGRKKGKSTVPPRRDRMRFENNKPPPTTDHQNTELNLSWSGRPGDSNSNASDDFDQLFYFFDGGLWFLNSWGNLDNSAFEIVYSPNGIHKLEKKGMDIGSAINLKTIFRGGGSISGVMYRDEEGGCFALVLHEFSKRDGYSLGQMRNRSFVFPIESFLYGTTERSFYKDGVTIDNSYYGAAGTSAFDFSHLPDKVFLKILHYSSPWRHRVLCRRVDRRWMAMCNLAISIDTRILDESDETFSGIRPSDVKWLLPIVYGGLEQMKLRSDGFLTFLEPDFLSSIPSFPKLRKIDFGGVNLTSIEAVIMLVEKTGSLKEIKMSIPETVPPTHQHSASFKQVDKFVSGNQVGYPQLAWIMEYFPQLTSLRVSISGSVTVSELSGVIEKYAHTLTHLEVTGDPHAQYVNPATASFTTLGECHNLEYCSLSYANYISDEFLVALATGCPKLATLALDKCKEVTSDGLAALALLPSLKRLNISSSTNDLTVGLTQLAQKANLEQIVADSTELTVDCLKMVVRHCPQLKLFSIMDCGADILIDEAKEIVNLYGKWGRSGRLILRCSDRVWRDPEVVEYIESTKTQRNQRDFVVKNRFTTNFLDEVRSNYEEVEEDDDEDHDDDEDDDYSHNGWEYWDDDDDDISYSGHYAYGYDSETGEVEYNYGDYDNDENFYDI